MKHWLGPYVWNPADNGFWEAPAGTLASLDLRSLPAQAQAETPAGDGLFTLPNNQNPGNDYSHLLTGSPDEGLTPRAKAILRSRLGLVHNFEGDSLTDCVWELLTTLADPEGLDRPKPLLPGIHRHFHLLMGGQQLRSRKFRPELPEAEPALAVLKKDYRALVGQLPRDTVRKVLGYWVRKFGLPPGLFIPGDLPPETPLDPETTITESFNTANSDTLGPDLSWTELSGDADVVSNQCQVPSAASGALARADTDLSGTDHYAQFSLVARGNAGTVGTGPICRKDSTGTLTYYHCRLLDSSANVQLYKIVANVFTQLGSNTGVSVGLPDTIKVQANGSTIECYYEGSSIISQTDTAITTGTRTGFRSSYLCGGPPTLDDFEAGDLAAASGQPYDKRVAGWDGFRGQFLRQRRW
jgi:hypothetical protein